MPLGLMVCAPTAAMQREALAGAFPYGAQRRGPIWRPEPDLAPRRVAMAPEGRERGGEGETLPAGYDNSMKFCSSRWAQSQTICPKPLQPHSLSATYLLMSGSNASLAREVTSRCPICRSNFS
jgi:hypothetical protein